MNRISNIISVSTGPSGFNSEYLFKLVNYLSGQKFHDRHLNEIAYQVWKKISYIDKDGLIIGRRRHRSFKDDIVYFNSRYNSLLSNFALVEGGVEFRGMMFPSAEHAFQSLKFVAEDRKRFTVDGDLGNFERGLELIFNINIMLCLTN